MAQRTPDLALAGRGALALRMGHLRFGLCGAGWRVRVGLVSFRFVQPEEARARPAGSGDRLGDARQRAPALATPEEPVLGDEHFVDGAAPFAHELGAGLEPDGSRYGEIARALQGAGEFGEPALERRAEAAERLLLELPCDAELEQVAADLAGRLRPEQGSPRGLQIGIGHLRQACEMPVEVARTSTVDLTLREGGGPPSGRARALPLRHGSALCRFGQRFGCLAGLPFRNPRSVGALPRRLIDCRNSMPACDAVGGPAVRVLAPVQGVSFL